jgi:Family of unknown function (DUF6272)
MEIEEEEDKFSPHQFYTNVRKHGISMAFQGIMSQDVLSLIGLSLKRRPDNEVIAKRVFGIVVELAQNIYHHSAYKGYSEKDKREIGVGVITIGENAQHYLVNSGNLIESSKIEALRQRCDHINNLDDDGLKTFYKEQRRQPSKISPDSPGASIGLIDLVRRSGNKLAYEINEVSESYAFLTMSVQIDK